MKLKQFIQQETVLTAAAVLAVVSAFFVLPDAQYLGYIDLRTLAILFSLMTVMAGLRRQGFFDGLGRALLSRTHSTFQLTLVLVGLCFFGSMFITNDVSLLTFVPFTFVVLSRLGADVRRSLLIPVVCMQTIAANLGSMLTPIGNPQNLYLYGKSGMSIGGFVLLMLPYTLVSLLLLLAWAALVCRKASAALSVDELVSSSASQGDQKIILLYLVLFAVCLLSVIRVLPYGIAFAAVLVCVLFADPRTLRAVDYSLLLTFVAFLIFIGNVGRIPGFSGWLHTDGYQGYHKLPENIRVVGCWAHARRKFDEALQTLPKEKQKDSPAAIGECYCSRLFKLEEAFAELTPEERYEKRLEQEKPVLDALLSWANEMQVKTAPKSAMGRAIHYLLEQWPYLTRYLEDGRLELSNNRAERSIKPFVMGRKNWLFANTPGGAQASSVIYSLIETAKENGLDPYRYLLWLLQNAPGLSETDEAWAEKLLPARARKNAICRKNR